MLHMNTVRRGRLITELVLLFGGIPVLLVFTEDIFPLIPTILLLTGTVIIAMRQTGWQYDDLLRGAPLSSWRNMLLVWVASSIFWYVMVYMWQPELLFSFAIERPDIWLLVMVLYPLVSAFPQEILYRTFIWQRYQVLFGAHKWGIIALSGISFMWGHLLFMNWFAIVITLIGGLTFAWRYQHTRSVLLVSVEHALYGNLFFTLGLGQFLFSGAV